MGVDQRGIDPLVRQPVEHRAHPIEARRVESRAHEAPAVGGVGHAGLRAG